MDSLSITRVLFPAFARCFMACPALMVSLLAGLVATCPAHAAEGLSDEELAPAIEQLADEELKKRALAGLSIGVARRGEVVFAKGFGLADLENDVPATQQSVYRIGSITKQFTAAAILQLAEQGKLALDDDIRKHLPDYQTHDQLITIHHLLTHTSGIPNYTNMPGWKNYWNEDRKPAEFVEFFQGPPLQFTPGSAWNYSNSGYFLLGLIIHAVSGQEYAEYLEEHVYKPAGLTATTYGGNQRLIKGRAQGYTRRFGKLVNDDMINMTAPYAAGALCSNVLDLIRWQQALAAGRVMSEDSYRLMTATSSLTGGIPLYYAYGLAVGEVEGRAKLSHGGGITGFRSQLSYYPDDETIVAVLINTEGSDPSRIENKIAELIFGRQPREIADLDLPAELRERCVGTYSAGPRKLLISEKDGQLYRRFFRQLVKPAKLLYQGEHRFSSPDGATSVEFRESDEGVGYLILKNGDFRRSFVRDE